MGHANRSCSLVDPQCPHTTASPNLSSTIIRQAPFHHPTTPYRPISLATSAFPHLLPTVPPSKTMSEEWQPYLDEYLVGKGNVAHAAIMSYPDGAVLAYSEGFFPQAYQADTYDEAGNEIKIDVDETASIIECAGTDWAAAPTGGLRLNQKKYMWLGTGEETSEEYGLSIKYARAKQGAALTACLAYSETSILIAVSDRTQGHDQSQMFSDVCELAAYLKSTGY